MKITKMIVAVSVALAATVAVAGTIVDRGVGWGFNPNGLSAYGAVTLAAATATKIPTTSIARGAIIIQNRDSSSIFCGSDTSVTDSTGMEVLQNGSISIPLSYNSTSGQVPIYCYSVLGQTAPLNTRYWETF